jgi:hypothetical protein
MNGAPLLHARSVLSPTPGNGRRAIVKEPLGHTTHGNVPFLALSLSREEAKRPEKYGRIKVFFDSAWSFS